MRWVVFFFLFCSIIVANAQETSRKLYVLNGLGRTLSSIDLETGMVNNDIISTGIIPSRLHVRNNNIYVVNSAPPGLQIIDSQSDQLIQSINLPEGSNPWDMAFAGLNKIYVTALVTNKVYIIDLENVEMLDTIEVGKGPEGILIVNNTAYVANTGGYPDYAPSSVSIIDIETDSVTKTLPVPANPQDFALAPDGRIHVLCTGNHNDISGVIAVIDPFGDTDFTAAVVDTIAVGGSPGDIVIDLTHGFLADYGDDSNGFIYKYDLSSGNVINNTSDPIRVGRGAMQLLDDYSTEKLFVANFGDDTIEELTKVGMEVSRTFHVGDGPQDMVVVESVPAFNVWADSVISFTPGEDAGFGQNFFPDNVLGPPDPDPALNIYQPSNKPQEILSLGHGGEIILEFKDEIIIDGEGPDFAVYENVFISAFDNKPFIEAAFVAASADGQEWHTFPWDTSTFGGFAGVTPTPLGGDMFDLADIGLASARYVKLTDIGDLKQEGMYNGDFDLDAVVVIHGPSTIKNVRSLSARCFELQQNYPNPFNPVTTIRFRLETTAPVQLRIFDTAGRLVKTLIDDILNPGTYSSKWNAINNNGTAVTSGVYLYQLRVADRQDMRKMIFIK